MGSLVVLWAVEGVDFSFEWEFVALDGECLLPVWFAGYGVGGFEKA